MFLICPPQNRTPKFQWDSSNLVNAVPQWPLLQESKGKSIQFEVNADYWSQFISNSKYVSTIQNQWKPVLTFTVSIVITDRLQFRYLAQIPSQGQVKVNSPTSKSVQNNFTVQNKIGSILQRELFCEFQWPRVVQLDWGIGLIPIWWPSGYFNQNWLVVTGTWLLYDFPYIGNFIIPTDELIFLRGVETTNQKMIDHGWSWII